MERLDLALDAALAALGLREASRRHRALALWSEVVGEGLAAHARAAAVRGGTLEVAVSDSAWANQIALMKSELLERLNLRLGAPLLSDLRVRIGPVARRPEPRGAEPLREEEIRRAEKELRGTAHEAAARKDELQAALLGLRARAAALRARESRGSARPSGHPGKAG